MQLTAHFNLDELTFSQTAVRSGIDNTPSEAVVENLKVLANGLEQVRALLGYPLHVNSGYRCPDLNVAIGGAKQSAHVEGWAADFICPQYGKPLEICKTIAASQIEFDKMIQEGTWVHISFAPSKRRECLTAQFKDGKASYTQGIA